MHIHEVLQRLKGVKKNGSGFMARCPAHDDRVPSLSIAESNDGAVLLKCHAGCTNESIVDALSMTMADLFPSAGTRAALPPMPSQPAIRSDEQPEALYVYRSPEDTALAEKIRYSGKRFVWRRPDGQGGWIWKRGQGRMPLYRIPDIRARGSSRVVVTEGEKDCDRIWTLDWPATTTADGAGSWKTEDTASLKTAGVKQVVILPDNDQPGRAHAQQVAASCYEVGLGVKVVNLPDVPDHGDVSDYLGHHSKADLATLIKETQAWRPSTGFKLTRLDTVTPRAVDWLWQGRLAKGKGTALAGDPGNGKSYLSCDVAARISRGLPWPDGGTAPKGKVLMLSAEDGVADTIRPRVDTLGGDASQITVLEAVIDDDTERLFALDRDVQRLTALLKQEHFALVIIDPATAYLGKVDSHKDADVRRVLAPLSKAIEDCGASLLMIMHLNKSAASAALYRVGGSIGLVATVRIGLVLGRDPDDQDRRILAPLKCNLSAEPPALAYRIDPAQGGLVWESAPVEMDAATMLAPRTAGESGADAAEWLRSYLEDGEVDSKTVFEAGGREGYSKGAINVAKKKLGVRPRKVGFSANARWVWSLPASPEDVA